MPTDTAAAKRKKVERLASETAGACLAFRVRAMSRRLTGIYEEVMRPLGLKATQMNVMTVAAMSRGEARLSHLAEMISLDPSSLSRIVDVMRRNGWLEFVPDPDDERARLVRLTDEGVALYAQAVPLWREAQEKVRTLLGEEGAEAFLELANQTLFHAPSDDSRADGSTADGSRADGSEADASEADDPEAASSSDAP